MKKFMLIICFVISFTLVEAGAETDKWKCILPDRIYVNDMAYDGHHLWFGLPGKKYLVKHDIDRNENELIKVDNGIISDDAIEHITFDEENRIWMSCNGITIYDGDSFKNLNTENSELPDNEVTFITRCRDNNFYIGTGQGLVVFDSETFVRKFGTDSLFTWENSSSAIIDFDGDLWIATSEGVFKNSNGKWEMSELPIERYSNMHFISMDSSGNIWALVGEYEDYYYKAKDYNNLYMYDGSSWINFIDSTSKITSCTQLHRISTDKYGRIWLSGKIGIKDTTVSFDEADIIMIDGDAWSYKKFQYGSDMIEPIAEGLVCINKSPFVYNMETTERYDISIRRQENLMTDEYVKPMITKKINDFLYLTHLGLLKYDGKWSSYKDQGWMFADSSSNLWWILSDNLWGGISKYMLLKYDSSIDNFTEALSPWNGLPCAAITGVAVDKNNKDNNIIWFSAADAMPSDDPGGLYKYDGKNFRILRKGSYGLPCNNFNSMAQDNEGNIWLANAHDLWYSGCDSGLTKFNGKSCVTYNKTKSNAPFDGVGPIIYDGKGILWMIVYEMEDGMMGGRVIDNYFVIKYDMENWTVFNSNNSPLPFDTNWAGNKFDYRNDFNTMAVDGNSNLWIAFKNQGVFMIGDNTFKHFSTENAPFSSNQIERIVFDKKGNTWFFEDDYYITIYNHNGINFELLTDVDIEREKIFTSSATYPNPFSQFQIMNYELREAGHVTLKVLDMLGNEVSTLVDGFMPAGRHEARFDGGGLAPGVYFYVLRAGSDVVTEKMILAR